MLELQVVVGSDRFGPGSQHRMVGDVIDALTGEPDLPVGVPQALEVSLTSTCSHDAFPFVCRCVIAGTSRHACQCVADSGQAGGIGYSSALSTQPGLAEKSWRGGAKMSMSWCGM